MAESKYATRLRELGCIPLLEPLTEGEQNFVILASILGSGSHPGRPLPRRERRALLAAGSIPSFCYDINNPENRIVIGDELGMCWIGPKEAGPALKSELKFSDLDERRRKRQN